MTNSEEINALRDKIETDLPASAAVDEVRELLLKASRLLAAMELSTIELDAAVLCDGDFETLDPKEKRAWVALVQTRKIVEVETAEKVAEAASLAAAAKT